MGCINLYKVDITRSQKLTQDLLRRMQLERTLERSIQVGDGKSETFGLSLYLDRSENQKDISWNWVLDEFDREEIQVVSSPKAVILVERDDGAEYAVTFGHSFFVVDKYCDGDFGFDFARRLTYDEIKTTTLTTPSSRRNKTVNTYINYNYLDIGSGESFSKLKAKVSLVDDFMLYKPAVEIGSSIKFVTDEDSLERILKLIVHVEDTIQNCPEIYKIPVFSKIRDEDEIQRLNAKLATGVCDNPGQVNIAELDIIGATEIFNNNDSMFELKYGRKSKKVTSLTSEELCSFCQENDLDFASVMLDIAVVSYYNGDPIVTKRVRDLIEYTLDEEMVLLSKGIWYRYNDDYLTYLEASIAEIDAEYHPEYDFTTAIHNAFVERKYVAEKDSDDYAGKSETVVKNALKTKYYAERAFNLLRAEDNGFQNFDRNPDRVGNSKVEEMDLYKDEAMYVVKIGNTSGKLCYAVDQSLTSLKLYKNGKLPGMPQIRTAVLWLVLDRGHIEDDNGKPDLSRLKMLMLKNRLDQWKKEVRLMAIRPLIYINYRSN